jgi:osomolarity two-component system sensor histidine kinase SLN1
MTDLIMTFNEMSDALLAQYTKLEDRVRQRTVELESSKKAAEAANESKTRFVANVSHELRTPLNGILGLAAVSMAENDPDRMRGSLSTIEKSGNLLLRTLNDLLTFSTNQLGHQVITLDEREFAIRDIETQTLAIFGQRAKEKCVNLRVIFEETPGDIYGTGKLQDLHLYGDIHRILQIVINLVGNSMKFTPPEGLITLRIRCLVERPTVSRSVSAMKTPLTALQQTSTNPGPEAACFINPQEVAQHHGLVHEGARSAPSGKDIFVELEVEDTGPGIEKEMQDRVFEPFVQADAGLSRKHNGTGLGLSISTQLVTLMDGTLRLKSTLGEGSTFTAKIPLRIVFNPSSETPRSSLELARTASRPSTGQQHPPALSRDSSDEEAIVVVDDAPATLTKSNPIRPSTPSISLNRPHLRPNKASPSPSTSSESSSAFLTLAPDFSQIRILVAEDNKVNQEVIQRMLRLEKVKHITIASDGQIALNHITSAPSTGNPPFDLILMDVQMPNMDGLQATRKIREAGFKSPIVALTAFAEKSNVEECYGSGMDFFLAKPVKRKELRDVLAKFGLQRGNGQGAEGVNGEAKTENEGGDAV